MINGSLFQVNFQQLEMMDIRHTLKTAHGGSGPYLWVIITILEEAEGREVLELYITEDGFLGFLGQ